MKILVGCEESQTVCIELRKLGHEAFSCDIETCSGGHPEWHLQMDVFAAIKLKKWDAAIFFPPCTYLANSANRWLKDQPEPKSGALVGRERMEARLSAITFFMALYNCDIPKICVENPVGIISTTFRKPDQTFQPWMFGHRESKLTCLWLKGLPKLKPTTRLYLRYAKIHKSPQTKDRSKKRSKTYSGVAKAMATQWFNPENV
jgi:hypothetical protein